MGKPPKSVDKKISLNPAYDIINPDKPKILYKQVRCNFCLKQSIANKKVHNYETKII